MSCMFPVTNQLLAQLDSLRAWKETTAHKNDVHLFPVKHDVAVAKLLLPALGAVLTVFMQEHAVYDGWFSTGQLDEYGSVSRTCQGSDIGRYATSSESDTGAVYFCNDCETGRYMDVTGVSACLCCASGTFADETASTTSTACASGSSTVTLGTVIWNLSKSIWANELRFLHRWFLRPFVWTDCVRSMRAWVCQRPRGSE